MVSRHSATIFKNRSSSSTMLWPVLRPVIRLHRVKAARISETTLNEAIRPIQKHFSNSLGLHTAGNLDPCTLLVPSSCRDEQLNGQASEVARPSKHRSTSNRSFCFVQADAPQGTSQSNEQAWRAFSPDNVPSRFTSFSGSARLHISFPDISHKHL